MATSDVPEIKNRDHAEDFLNARIGHGVKPGLERVSGLLEFMGQPQLAYPTIHIAGTNGKTTVARMVQQILGAHGLATGGFTSPHLHEVEERFTIHGVAINPLDFADAVGDMAWFVVGYEESSGESVTYFEVTAALAFSIFATAAVDVAVIEVGLGGRLDATNVIDAQVSVVTGIDVDHIEFLGSAIDGIAAEKAAILKADGTLVTGPLQEEASVAIQRRVDETGSNWIRTGADFRVADAELGVQGWHCSVEGVFSEYDDLFLPLHGRHQLDNLATAIATCEMFLGNALDNELLTVAVASIQAPGRLEVVGRRPIVLVDGAHNAQGFLGLASTIDTEFPAMQWQLVLGIRGNRNIVELVEPLNGLIGHVFATDGFDTAAISADRVGELAGSALDVPSSSFSDPQAAVEAARDAAGSSGGVIVTGSLYLVGEVRGELATVKDSAAEAHLRFDAARFDDEDMDDDGVDDDAAYEE